MKYNKIIDVPVTSGELTIDRSGILSLLGYNGEVPDPMFLKTVDEYLADSKNRITPKGGFIVKKTGLIDKIRGEVEIDKKILRVGKTIASQLKGVQYIALFACTIGPQMERYSKKLISDGDLLEGYCVNLIASEAAECVAEAIHQYIGKFSKTTDMKVTNRFSPGYCDWDVSEQFSLFGFLDGSRFGITLNDSAMMDPIKSVSGIVGIGHNVLYNPYTCALCNYEKCIYRNKRIKADSAIY
jgi:hypothetical protein